MRRPRGFSLIEILVVLGIAATILGVGIPYFVRNRANEQARQAAESFASTVRFAHNLAIRNGDGAAFRGNIPSASGSAYNVYAVHGGRVDAQPAETGDASNVESFSGAQDGVVQTVGDASTFHPTVVHPVGAVLVAPSSTLIFDQDGSLDRSAQAVTTWTFSNGYTTYTVTVTASGTATVTAR